MKAPGGTLLKVVSVLFIVCGCGFVVGSILSLVVSNLLATSIGSHENVVGLFGGILSSVMSGIFFILLLIPAAVDLTFGIIGLKHSGNPEKAAFFIAVGIILCVIGLLSIFALGLWGVLNLVLPALFITGGFKNKSAAVKTQSA